MPIEKGNKVKIHYTGTLEDGTVFDSSEGRDPLEFEVGSKQVIPGFDEALVGMEKDEEKEITLPPERAYGQPIYTKASFASTETKTSSKLPKEPEPKVGMQLLMTAPTGQQIPVTIKKVTDKDVTIDLNPPLAGKTLKFKIKVVSYE